MVTGLNAIGWKNICFAPGYADNVYIKRVALQPPSTLYDMRFGYPDWKL